MRQCSTQSHPVIVLAGGESRRMGMPKGLVPFEGRPWLLRQLAGLKEAGLRHAVLVLGHGFARYAEALPELDSARTAPLPLHGLDVRVAVNPEPSLGQFSSIQTGLRAMGAGPVFILPIDTPCPGAPVWSALAQALEEDSALCIPTHEETGGHPVLLGEAFARHALAAPPDSRLDHLISGFPGRKARVAVPDERVRFNCNTPEELALHAHRS